MSGFNAAEEMHGVRYMRVIGDGDSSMMCDIHQYVPIWGHMVTKIEFANHAIKCYRNRLEKITQVQGERQIDTTSNQEIDGWGSVCYKNA